MEPTRQRGLTWGDVGGLLAALFHLAVLVVGVGLIAAALMGGLAGSVAGWLGLN